MVIQKNLHTLFKVKYLTCFKANLKTDCAGFKLLHKMLTETYEGEVLFHHFRDLGLFRSGVVKELDVRRFVTSGTARTATG